MITIEAIINEDGETSIVVHGIKGKSCLNLTKDLENLLGVVTNRVLMPEYRAEDQLQKNRGKIR